MAEKRVIVFTNNSGGVSVCTPTGELSIEQVQIKDIPAGTNSFIVDASTLPQEVGIFFGAWEQTNGNVTINIDKAKLIAHDARRAARAAEFAPLDTKATIPSEAVAAEAARQVIRDKYAVMQTKMDAATTIDELKAVLPA